MLKIEAKEFTTKSWPGSVSWCASLRLDAEFSTNGGSDCIGMMSHQWFRFRLYHDSRQRFRPGVTDNDASRVSKVSLGSANRGGHSRNSFERLFLADFHIDYDLRKNFEVSNQFRQRSAAAVNDIKQQ